MSKRNQGNSWSSYFFPVPVASYFSLMLWRHIDSFIHWIFIEHLLYTYARHCSRGWKRMVNEAARILARRERRVYRVRKSANAYVVVLSGKEKEKLGGSWGRLVCRSGLAVLNRVWMMSLHTSWHAEWAPSVCETQLPMWSEKLRPWVQKSRRNRVLLRLEIETNRKKQKLKATFPIAKWYTGNLIWC